MDNQIIGNQIKGLPGGQYKPLTSDHINLIHEASLQILARTGVQINEPEALKIFSEAGAQLDGNIVCLSQGMIESAIDSAPKRLLLAGQSPEHDLVLEGSRVYTGTGGAALQVLDLQDGEIRPAVLQDISDVARLVEALPNVHFYLIPVYPTDVPVEVVDINMSYASLSNTYKHVQSGVYSIQGIHDTIEMCEHIAGGADQLRDRPIISFITSWMMSPLKFTAKVTRLLMEICRQRMPVVLSAAPVAGMTAPVTLAGLLAQLNAEQLAGLVLTQMVSPGCPVLYGAVPGTTDMRSGKYLAGAVEFGMCNAAITQIAHSYGLPIYNSAGLTDAKVPDIQAGIEKAQSIIQVSLAGANFIHHGAGMLEDMSTIAYEQFVIDNQMLGMAMRAVRGIEVNEDTLAVEVIDRVGPGGNYILDEHTIEYMHSEHYYPDAVYDRKWRKHWQDAGSTTAWDRARGVARRILAESRPQVIDPGANEWIQKRFRSKLIF